LFALVAAAASSTILYKVISASTRPSSKAASQRVLLASRDLNGGALIGEGDVREVEWPAGGGAKWIQRREDVIGRGLTAAISKDEPFTESRLAARGSGVGLASRIPPGMRLVGVHVDELSGLARAIFPGMHVDVISTANQNGQGMITRTILQNIEVFSNGRNAEHDGREKPATVPVFDLLVTPQQAEILSQAVAQSRIELVLRNPLDKGSFVPVMAPVAQPAADHAVPKTAQTSVRETQPEKTVAAPAPPPVETVEVIHGTRKTITTVGAALERESKP
jgi:pilus assembly protein CpaB